MEPDGDFVVAWTSPGQGGIFGQRFSAPATPRGLEFQINVVATGQQKAPDIAVGSGGDFVVAWESSEDNFFRNIKARRYDMTGSAIGGEFLVNAFTTGFQNEPSIGRATDGRFVIAWTSQHGDGNLDAIAARRYDAAGNAIGAPFVVNTYTTGAQRYGAIAVAPSGGFVVVWEDYVGNRDGSFGAIFGQRFDASGNRAGGEFLVNTYTTGSQKLPAISMSPSGGFVVSWWGPGDGDTTGVFARVFDASGNPVGSDFVVNASTTGYQSGPAVAHDPSGNFIVAWTGIDFAASPGIFGQRFDPAGGRRGLEFSANAYTGFGQRSPAVGTDSTGNFVVTWDSSMQDGSDYGVFARRFGAIGAAGLAVDATPTPSSNGNGVLEPGETVPVVPSWRNGSGAAQSFAAGLSAPSGPAGAVPVIVDGSGAYGPVPEGSIAACTDCYLVRLPPGPAQPVHRDATALETIVPAALGGSHVWRLHIGDSFTDVPRASGFYRFVETLLHHGVTGGCTGTHYCPSVATTREQMAVFVLVAKEGAGYVPPACTAPIFADVPASSPFCPWIGELARRGVVGGCGGPNYCPSQAVTREQMAVFVLRTLDRTLNPASCTTPRYGDVPASSPFCPWIEELTRRNVVGGCGGGNYCPGAPVTREQMGVFISGTFGLTLYGP
jgi:hypothetical protein